MIPIVRASFKDFGPGHWFVILLSRHLVLPINLFSIIIVLKKLELKNESAKGLFTYWLCKVHSAQLCRAANGKNPTVF
jgi:hypothetical protein